MANRHDRTEGDQELENLRAELEKAALQKKVRADRGRTITAANPVGISNSGGIAAAGPISAISSGGGFGGGATVASTQQPSSTLTHGTKRILRLSAHNHPTLSGVVVCDLCSAIVDDFKQHVKYHQTVMHARGGDASIFEPFLFDSVIEEEPDVRDLEEP